jgi:hypothetical protein
MTKLRQIEANRRNARLSTGPVTDDGKRRSRRNALRHGLSAETVIGALEDADDYAAFEIAVNVDYDPQTAVERELVLRLASLLWRLRRASAIERGLVEMGAKHPFHVQRHPDARSVRLTRLDTEIAVAPSARSDPSVDHDDADRRPSVDAASFPLDEQANESTNESNGLTRSFLHLAGLATYPLDRLSRYETALWRQVRQILITLGRLERRRSLERTTSRTREPEF